MASTAYLQQAYLAYFGRPADVSGLSFYASKTEAQVVAAFSASPESQAFFGSLNTLAQINTIYQNLFNRAAEPAGLVYWAAEINAGRLSLAQASMGILAGAQNDDKLAVTNKLAAATAFTAALDTSAEMIGYQGSAVITSARAYLASVGSTAASLTAATATAALNASVATVVAAGTSSASDGLAFTLTTDSNTVTGTAGDDVIYAKVDPTSSISTLGDGDSIDGGAGSDMLIVTLNTDANTASFAGTLDNVETLKINAGAATAGGAATLDISSAVVSGLDTVVILNNKTVDVSFVAADLTEVVFEFDKLGAGSVAISATSANAATLSLDFLSSATSANIDFAGETDITSLVITVKDDVTFNALTVEGTSEVVTVTVSGTGDVDLSGATAVTGATALTSVDASALKGDLTLTVTADTLDIDGATDDNTIDVTGDKVTVTTLGGDDEITVTGKSAGVAAGAGDDTITAAASGTVSLEGGAGDDTIDISASSGDVSSADKIDGGAGTDTLVIGAADAASITVFDNFEKLVIGGSGSTTLDISSLSAFTSIEVADTAAVSFTNVDGETISVADSADLTVDGTSDDADSVIIDVTGKSETSQTGIDIAVENVEDITLTISAVSSTGASAVTIDTLSVTGATVVVINIDADTAASTVNIVTIAAATLEADDLTLNIAAASAEITLLSHTGGSVFDLSVSGDDVTFDITTDAATSAIIDISGSGAAGTINADAATVLSVVITGDSATLDIGADSATVVSLDISGSSNAVTLDISAATDITIDISGDAVTLDLGTLAAALTTLAITSSGSTNVVDITSAAGVTSLEVTATSGDLELVALVLTDLESVTVSGAGAIDIDLAGAGAVAPFVVDLSGFSGTLNVLDIDAMTAYTAATITIGDVTGAKVKTANLALATTGAILLGAANAVVDTIAFTSASASGLFNITGFEETTEDLLDLTAFGIVSIGQLTLTDVGANLTITSKAGDFDFTICLAGVQTANFTVADLVT